MENSEITLNETFFVHLDWNCLFRTQLLTDATKDCNECCEHTRIPDHYGNMTTCVPTAVMSYKSTMSESYIRMHRLSPAHLSMIGRSGERSAGERLN